MGRAAKEEGRQKAGPASPEVRRAIIRKEMGLDKAEKSATKPTDVKAKPEKPVEKNTDAASGLNKLLRPKSNIERRLAEMGE